MIYLRLKNIHCLHGTQGIQTLAFNFAFQCRLLSSPALSRVASPNHMCCVVARGRDGGAGGRGGAGSNRLVTSIGELALGPLPCQLSPDRRILEGQGHDGSKTG